MKGITHFAAGLAAASLVPGAVEMARDGSLVILIGGVAGVLPDTIDFKWSKFVETYHHEIDPDPHRPDPQKIADEVAAAIDDAYEAGGASRGLMIHTTRLGADLWREVVLTLDAENQEVRCKIGPAVTTGQIPVGDPDPFPGVAVARTKHPFHESYLDTIRVNIFSGPSWDLRLTDGKVHLNFIAWHRRGTHSIFFGVCMVALGLLLFGDWRYGAAMAAGVITHQLEDQLGFMGCSFLWPFHHRRFRGLEIWHSGDPWANFSSIWLSMVILGFQLNRYRADPPVELGPLAFFFWFAFVPLFAIWVCKRLWFQKPPRRHYSLPRTGHENDDEEISREEAMLQNIKEQDVVNEMGGDAGTV